MPEIEVTVTAPPRPQQPVDENVHLPESVRAQAKRADDYYKPAAAAPEPAPPTVAVTPAPAAPAPAAPAAPAPIPTAAAPVAADAPYLDPAFPDDQVTPEQWRHRYQSMKGRWEKRGEQVSTLQNNFDGAVDELLRSQEALSQRPGSVPAAPAAPAAPLITDKDREEFGPDMVDFATRAARAAVAPELEALQTQNRALQSTTLKAAQTVLYRELDIAVPNWREINADARWKAWLRLPDLYSRQVRGRLLQDAFQAADAPRVIAFLNGFISHEAAMTRDEAPTPPSPTPAQQPAPRTPPLALEAIASPARSPSGSDNSAPAEKPIYTREQIKTFYAQVRQGLWRGRDDEKLAIERDMFAAQSEGRIH